MDKVQKNERIYIRLTHDEKSKIMEKAKNANLSVSHYCIQSACNAEIVNFDEISEMNRQLLKIGNNLNQLTMLAHQGKITSVRLEETVEAFDKIWDALYQLSMG